ncbi:uncharacterized protein LOC122079152 [Macadamia integrifolia]|uniref:uncharacterized protein LOC122079152 n=1 Tax=Macadamia integrifolia TaxID=60698 RepID=UPI001C4F1ADC|nr:uncharacterized protein LOC122079152 [Macadamia integrifolia]
MHISSSMEKLAQLYIDNIVRYHGVPIIIVSDYDSRYTSKFWESVQKAMKTKLNFSTTFHPQTDRQIERTIQTLEVMLRACVVDMSYSWDEHIPLVEFANNSSYQSTIGMAPFEALYGKKCRTPLHWDEVGERKILEPELVEATCEKVDWIRERIKVAQSKQKSYADNRRKPLEFEVGEKKYIPDPSHVLHVTEPLELDDDLSNEEQPKGIFDRKEYQLWSRTIPYVKIKLKNHRKQEASWVREDEVKEKYQELFESPGEPPSIFRRKRLVPSSLNPKESPEEPPSSFGLKRRVSTGPNPTESPNEPPSSFVLKRLAPNGQNPAESSDEPPSNFGLKRLVPTGPNPKESP